MTVCLRYALYYAPAPGSAWARFGGAWLAPAHPLLNHPRRYGFHATLKAPFRLHSDASIEQLVEELDAFARAQAAFSVPQMQLAHLDDFLALVPASPEPRLDALAAHCVKRFDRWRAPSTPRNSTGVGASR